MADLQQMASKSFWKKPEGTTGKIILGALAVAGGLLVYKYLPILLEWLVMVLENAVYAGILGVALLVLTSPIWNARVRTLVTYMARSFLRAITGWFVEIDPIGILKNYVEDLKKSLATMDKQISNLWGHITRMKNIIAQNKAEQEHSLKLAGVAKEKGIKTAFQLNARKAGRKEKSNRSLQEVLTKMEALHKLLSKLRETSDFTIQDMEDEVQTKEQERKAILASYGAFTSALNVLRGNPDKRALFDQANEYLAEDYARKVGEIEDFMKVSEGFIASVDLENGVFEEDALAELEKRLDSQTEQMLLAPVERRVRVDTTAGDDEPDPDDGNSASVKHLFERRK